jgi:hypothetical protein
MLFFKHPERLRIKRNPSVKILKGKPIKIETKLFNSKLTFFSAGLPDINIKLSRLY